MKINYGYLHSFYLFERLLDSPISGIEILRKLRGSIDISSSLKKVNDA